MALNIIPSNYINSQTTGLNGGQTQGLSSGAVSQGNDSVVVKGDNIQFQAGQTFSGEVLEVDGKDIKLLLSNNQTVNASLEGSINASIGQILSFEVKSTEGGQTALRPLYTNLDNSPQIANALSNAGLPNTVNYAKMVSQMMNEGMPISREAVQKMAQKVNTFPTANPETLVSLNKLGLQINELTINQYENYKGLEHQILKDVNSLSDDLTNLVKDSLSELVESNTAADAMLANNGPAGAAMAGATKLFNAFMNVIQGNNSNGAENQTVENISTQPSDAAETTANTATTNEGTIVNSGAEDVSGNVAENTTVITEDGTVTNNAFDVTKTVIDLIDPEALENTPVSPEVNILFKQLQTSAINDGFPIVFNHELNASSAVTNEQMTVGVQAVLNELTQNQPQIINTVPAVEPDQAMLNDSTSSNSDLLQNNLSGNMNSDKNFNAETGNFESFSNLDSFDASAGNNSERNVFSELKTILDTMAQDPAKASNATKERLVRLLTDDKFGEVLKSSITKQFLLKPEAVTSTKNIEELYSKITKQAEQALNVLEAAGKSTPETAKAVNNISDNVNFMNELNQAVTYVQIPLMMNGKAAHGDLYVYTKKKSLANNDGNISALLHLDMDNLGPMDVYVKLTNGTKVNTHFYLQDDATIDFIESHIDLLNERLIKKGYETDLNVSVKDDSKGATNMSEEFMKSEPFEERHNFSKFSFDVRA